MFAASPPVKFGISARLVSTMLTMNEPENTGPITTYALWSTAFCASALAVCGADWVSIDMYSILRPRMPPAALISFTASFTPLSKLVPSVFRVDVIASVRCRRGLCGEPGRGLTSARGDRWSRQVQVFIVDDVEGVF